MRYPLSTGQAARLFLTTEPQLAELVRRGKIRPEPRIVAGRRLWEESHLSQVAEFMGIGADGFTAALEGFLDHRSSLDPIERMSPSGRDLLDGKNVEEVRHD